LALLLGRRRSSSSGQSHLIPSLRPTRLRLTISIARVLCRSIFRTIELLDGWSGKLATDQVLFSVLDGGMIVLSSLLLNIFHPMFLLRSSHSVTGKCSDTEEAMKEVGNSSTEPHYIKGRAH
jgi:hypothetical protein